MPSSKGALIWLAVALSGSPTIARPRFHDDRIGNSEQREVVLGVR
jgi:hypothetical protein